MGQTETVHGPFNVRHKQDVNLINAVTANLWREAILHEESKSIQQTGTTIDSSSETYSDSYVEHPCSSDIQNDNEYVRSNGGQLVFETNDFQVKLNYLRSNNKVKRRCKWQNMDIKSFIECFKSASLIQIHFTKDEIQGCLSVLSTKFKSTTKAEGLSSKSNKLAYVNFVSKLAGNSSVLNDKRANFQPKPLKVIIKEKMRSVKKSTLNKIESIRTWPKAYSDWKGKHCWSVTRNDMLALGYGTKHEWFSSAETTNYGQLLRFVDHHHLLTNCRIHCCKNGYPQIGIKSSAWQKVAKENKSNNSGLNIAYVEDLIDPQSNAVAKLTFSQKVEDAMISNGDTNEATFCRLIRCWYNAVDEKGLSASERVFHLMNLREFLLDSCSDALERFPPPGRHVNDMPVVLFTGLLISCERLIQLYKMSKSGSFNVRSIGSLDNETFFSSFRDLDPRGAGILRPSEIPNVMSVACEIIMTRLNPNRGYFFNTTTKQPVYNTEPLENSCALINTDDDRHTTDNAEDCIFRNHHAFDAPRTTTAKRKHARISTLEECAHGAQGIRQFHRRDEEKILPHKRACVVDIT